MWMKENNTVGKVRRHFLEEVILSKINSDNPEIRTGPKHGVDTGAINISKEKLMVFSTDPLSIIPSIGLEDSGWLSAQILFNDFVTCSLPPEYVTLCFNLPPKITDDEFKTYWESLIKEFDRLDVSVISGHTGRYVGCDYSIVGSGTIMGVGDSNHYINSSMARTGDSVIITKGIAIESTSVIAKAFPKTIAKQFGKNFLEKIQKTFHQCSAVKDALIASSVGVGSEGVTAMHDITEGGVFGALSELASASVKGLLIEKKSIPISDEAEKTCSFFGINPYTTLSSGSMLITVTPEKEIEVIKALKSNDIPSTTIGKVTAPKKGCYILENESKKPLTTPDYDSYWNAFWKATQKRWS